MTSGYKSQNNSPDTGVNMFAIYADAVARHFKLRLTKKDKIDIADIARPYVANSDSMLKSREGFKAVTAHLQDRFSLALTDDPELLSKMRENARNEYGLQNTTDNTGVVSHPKDETNDVYIDAEVIAIYW
jgi:hypothetical protein